MKKFANSFLSIVIGALIILIIVLAFIFFKKSQNNVNLLLSSLDMGLGETVKLDVEYHSKEKDEEVVFVSENPLIVSVTNDGVIKALSYGKTMVKAMLKSNNAIYDTCEIKVIKTSKIIELKSLVNKLDLKVSEEKEINYEVIPNDYVPNITWSSKDEKIAKVQNGVVKGISKGTTIIEAKEASGLSFNVEVNVSNVDVTKIELSRNKIELREQESDKIEVVVLPENATDKSLTWVSSDENIVEVQDGLIKAKNKGTALIKVTSSNGISLECEIIVKEKIIDVTNILLNHAVIEMKVNTKEKLVATIFPSNATDKSITWASSDDTVATVQNGEITAKKQGTAIISATSNNKVVAKCTINVRNNGVKIRVGTVNMGYYKCGSSKITCSPTWQNFRDIFRNSNASLIGVQEGGAGAGNLSYSASKAGYNLYHEAPYDRLGILSKYPFVSKDYWFLTSCEHQFGMIKAVVNINGVNVSFYDTHISWNLKNNPCNDIHFQDIANIIKTDPNPAILVADFNIVMDTRNFYTYFSPLGGVIAAHDTSTTNMWNSESYCDSVVVFPKNHISIISQETTVIYKKYSDHNFVIATLEIY